MIFDFKRIHLIQEAIVPYNMESAMDSCLIELQNLIFSILRLRVLLTWNKVMQTWIRLKRIHPLKFLVFLLFFVLVFRIVNQHLIPYQAWTWVFSYFQSLEAKRISEFNSSCQLPKLGNPHVEPMIGRRWK